MQLVINLTFIYIIFSKTRSKAKSGDNPDEGDGSTEQPASRRRKPPALLDTDEFIMFDSLVSGMLLSFKQLIFIY